MFLVGRQLRIGVLIKGIVQWRVAIQLSVNSQDTAELRVAATPPRISHRTATPTFLVGVGSRDDECARSRNQVFLVRAIHCLA